MTDYPQPTTVHAALTSRRYGTFTVCVTLFACPFVSGTVITTVRVLVCQ